MTSRHDEQRRSWTCIEEDMVSAISVLNVKKYIRNLIYSVMCMYTMKLQRGK
jgi:hypothetical protein